MAEGTDAVDAVVVFQFVGTGIDIDLNAIEIQRPHTCFFQRPHVRIE